MQAVWSLWWGMASRLATAHQFKDFLYMVSLMVGCFYNSKQEFCIFQAWSWFLAAANCAASYCLISRFLGELSRWICNASCCDPGIQAMGEFPQTETGAHWALKSRLYTVWFKIICSWRPSLRFIIRHSIQTITPGMLHDSTTDAGDHPVLTFVVRAVARVGMNINRVTLQDNKEFIMFIFYLMV